MSVRRSPPIASTDCTYAVPVDAACQVAVFRPDLMQRLDQQPPRAWREVLDLGQMAERQGLKLAIGLASVHSLMTFFTLMAGWGQPCATSRMNPSATGPARAKLCR